MSQHSDALTQDPRGDFACPICGHGSPHPHTESEKYGYWEDQVRADGWISAAKERPKERGWYLCMGIDLLIPSERRDENGSVLFDGRRRELLNLKWLRDPMDHGYASEVPEVLYYDPLYGGFQLRHALGHGRHDGSEGRWRVSVQPKYWREVPALNTKAVEDAKHV